MMAAEENHKVVDLDEEEEKHEAPSTGCGILARYPVISILSFASVGIAIGLGISDWDPEDPEDKAIAIQWIGLIGEMFIRALKAVVLPLVFVNVVLSVIDMMFVGSAGSVGLKTIGLYLLTTLIAAIIGLISIVSFQSLFDQGEFDVDAQARFQLGCGESGGHLASDDNGTVQCVSGNLTESQSSIFYINDIDATFVTKSSSGPQDDISMSDTIYDGVFRKLITDNIFESFVDANFAAVVLFAIVFGAALGRVMQKKKMGSTESILVKFLKEVDAVLLILINWIIMITPFAVLSLIGAAIGKQDNLSESFQNVGYLVAATLLAMFAHVVITYIGGYYLLTGENPFTFLNAMLPAQTTAFACASSAATIPVTLRCVQSTGKVPGAIAKFVIPMGATINMDGGAIYFPCACIWLASLNGITPNFGNYILLAILATIGSAGTAPVPSASLVLIITAYNTVFGTTGTPDGFSFILAIDWFMDRCRTVVNITGDSVVTGIVASRVPYNAEEELNLPESAADVAALPDKTARGGSDKSDTADSPDDLNV